MKSVDILFALHPITVAFDQLSIPYYIGGSIASSVYGFARMTRDIDIAADIKKNQVKLLSELLQNEYYIDPDMIFEALDRKTSFNIIHNKSMIKIDIFIVGNDPYQLSALQRKRKDNLEENASKQEYFFSSAEDIIINKLKWYEMGGKISDRQWLDILGILKVQGDGLNRKYLEEWTKKLGLYDLLLKAYKESID